MRLRGQNGTDDGRSSPHDAAPPDGPITCFPRRQARRQLGKGRRQSGKIALKVIEQTKPVEAGESGQGVHQTDPGGGWCPNMPDGLAAVISLTVSNARCR